MAQKRTRATFEADLLAQQSPYVVYGTPLPPLDPDTRDDGSYVPVWKQEVTDEKGRKRLHGAFTGGFSAGYFNTVGSKEGWTPSTFTSSRKDKKKDGAPTKQQKPEDFMDEEDIADAEEAKKLQTTESFAGFGTGTDVYGSSNVMDVFKTTGETMGVKLLKKMGWREGQGIGPKVRRKARTDDKDGPGGDNIGAQDLHLFAPEDSKMISFIRKNDRKGLGFEGEGPLAETGSKGSRARSVDDEEDEDTVFGTLARLDNNKIKPNLKKQPQTRGAIGVGILNDSGSENDDLYSMGPKISYNRVMGGDKKKKKKPESGKPLANPLLSNKPVFVSKKAAATKLSANFRRCHDGRLPLDGFVLSSDPSRSSSASHDGIYPPPKIPPGWKSSKTPSTAAINSSNSTQYRSTAEMAKSSTLSPKSRAAILGEVALPGKSVFDYLTPNARSRIATATKNQNLPPALSEASHQSPTSKSLQSLIPALSSQTAHTALGRGTAGWMPYAEDLSKRGRYRLFLEIRAGLRPEGTLPEKPAEFSTDDWVKEMQEFAHAAQIFKPMTGLMATRFTSSSSAPKLASDAPDRDSEASDKDTGEGLLRKPMEKGKDPAQEAARLGMYGPLTRDIKEFYPTRLLCKRFNIQPPAHVQVDPGQAPPDQGSEAVAAGGAKVYSEALPQRKLEIIGKRDMDELMRERGSQRIDDHDSTSSGGQRHDRENIQEKVIVDPDRNEALEKERPGEEVFRAIFGSDSEDD
ncbi:MAG: hypothetical protein Q9219_004650 [cf. Caloplaca sp. 3 TL-2023]